MRPQGWSSRHERVAYGVCALLAVAAIWCHRYPAGIDLPQHANLFRLWVDLARGPLEYRQLYRVDPFTPYLLAYAVAYPLTLLFGALVAVKCLLTVVALGTPLLMRQWLVSVGARPELGLFGFLLAFDFQYQCGFLSHSLALPLMFAYLAANERQGSDPGWRAMLPAALLGVALFFCHGITFGVCMVIVACRVLLERRALRRAVHVVPVAALALLWLVLRQHQTTESPTYDWFANGQRLLALFSGPFVAFPSGSWAMVTLVALAVFLVVTRPRLVWQARRLAPVLLAIDGFLILPETVAATMVVASRFCVYVHAFAPAAVDFRSSDWLRRQAGRVVFAMVCAGLLVLNVRLYRFNGELVGLSEIARHIEPGADVRNLMPASAPHSATFGPMQLGQVPAWITAAQGGLIDNDSAKYYQVPLKRNDVPFPIRFRYLVARGDVPHVSTTVASMGYGARLVHQAPPWLLFEEQALSSRDFTVVRSAQSWGQLGVNMAVTGAPLVIAGMRFPRGLGVSTDGFVRVRIERAGATFAGACGIGDQTRAGNRVAFRIRDEAGQVLFDSGEARGGQPARRFAVALAGRRQLLLEARNVGSSQRAYADWVDLRVADAP